MSSILKGVEAQFAKAKAAVEADVAKFKSEAENLLHGKVIALAADAKTALAAAQAQALKDVEAAAPEVKAAVEKAVSEVEAAVVSAIEAHLS